MIVHRFCAHDSSFVAAKNIYWKDDWNKEWSETGICSIPDTKKSIDILGLVPGLNTNIYWDMSDWNCKQRDGPRVLIGNTAIAEEWVHCAKTMVNANLTWFLRQPSNTGTDTQRKHRLSLWTFQCHQHCFRLFGCADKSNAKELIQ